MWRGGGYAAILFLLFSFLCTADHERDWPPCKVVFFGLETNTLNVRNNVFCVHEEYLGVVDMTSHVGPYPLSLPLTSLCDLPLLFIYFQVNNDALYFLIISKTSTPLCSLSSFQSLTQNILYFPLPLTILY